MQTVGELSSASRDLALQRFRLLEPHLEHDRPLRAIAAEAGVPFRTVQRWAAQYRRFGLVALARKMRGDNGVRRAVSANLKAAIEGLALERPPLPITSIYRQVKQFAASTDECTPVKASILFIDAKRRSQTPSGKPITRNSIFFFFGKTGRQRSHG